MPEQALDGQQEIPRRLVLEIGANPENSFLKQYSISLPPGTVYEIENVRYGLLPNETDSDPVLHFKDESVDEIVMSNVLGDIADLDFIDQPRITKFWEYYLAQNPEEFNHDKAMEEVAYFQKLRTIQDILRVLKPNGVLTIYENYRQYHPVVVGRILEWFGNNPNLELTEDVEEERRLEPIFNKENSDWIAQQNKHHKTESFEGERLFLPRPLNKVYVVRKKKPN